MFAVRLLGNRTAAEVKIGMTGIATWPTASFRGQLTNLLGGGRAWVGEGGALGGRQGGLFRRRLDAERSAAAIRLGRGRNGDLLNLSDRHHPRGQETEHDGDSEWNAAVASLPTSHASGADAKQLGDAVLCDAERGERRAEFGRVRLFWLESVQGAPQREAQRQRSRTAILTLKLRPSVLTTLTAKIFSGSHTKGKSRKDARQR
jgi:hypothetical protein